MVKKIVYLFVTLLLLYMTFKVISQSILDNRITYDNIKPKIKLSQIITISESRIEYIKNYYIDGEFVGFNATIDKKYFLTVTKLGKVSGKYRFIRSYKTPENSGDIAGIPPSGGGDVNGRYVNFSSYPFIMNKIYYSTGNSEEIKINNDSFYELETIFTFFTISFTNEKSKDFGFVGPKREKSISFINYNGNLYVFNLCPIGNNSFKSLHSLLNL